MLHVQDIRTESDVLKAMSTHHPDDGGGKDPLNVDKLTPVYTALQPRRQPSSNQKAVSFIHAVVIWDPFNTESWSKAAPLGAMEALVGTKWR
jgi:hypothetical protein